MPQHAQPASDPSSIRVLVVDDEQYLADAVSMALRYEGWTVAIASTGSEALAAYRGSRPDIAILDVMLPDTDGFALLTELRQLDPHLPVLMLTARDSTQDRVSGLQLGADDYLVKPFSLEELVARLQAILRRTSAQPDRAAAERIVVGDLVIDVPGRQVQRAGEPVTLTPTEFELLALLARNAGAVLAKGLILDRVWNYDFSGNSNVVELYVGYLRRKLDPLGPPMIHTVRGVGYVMRVPGGQPPVSARARPGNWWRRRSLPIQLVVGLTALTLTTALLAGAIVLAALSTYLTDQLNAQVEQLSSTAAEALHEAGEHDGKGSDRRGLSGDAIAAGFDASGDYSSAAGPDVSAGTRDAMAAWLSAGRPWASGSVMSDVTLDGDDYRVLVSTRSDGSTLMSGLPADPVSETIEQLLKLEVLVGAVAIGVVAIGTYCFVRWRLIPIRRLADGASSLAVDDGSLRLDDESGSAEIAALSESLTLMLNRIDESMSAKSQAEARLRQFVADASHELRTPLASIRGYAEVLRRGLAVDPQDRDLPLDRIESETVRLAGLVNDLLLLATLDEDQPLRLARLDLGPLVAQCAADSEAADPRRQLSVLMADQEFWIDGDGDRLTQVFANLLGNVRAHTAPGSHAEIELEQDTSNIIVKVSDRGPGIPAASLPTIFDRFARADTGRARNQGGSGLGLAIVESIVHAHHGTIQIANREGGGLVVTLTLPRAGVEPGARGRASD